MGGIWHLPRSGPEGAGAGRWQMWGRSGADARYPPWTLLAALGGIIPNIPNFPNFLGEVWGGAGAGLGLGWSWGRLAAAAGPGGGWLLLI